MLPEGFYLVVVSVFGLVIGSFLNVVIYRLHTGKSLNSRSHCLSCGKLLRWYELFPVLSFLVLRGRCAGCCSHIPYRYALVELLTAAMFVLAYVRADSWGEFSLLSVLVSLLVVGVVYDLYHMIIPDEVSLGVALVMVAWLGLQTLQGGGMMVLWGGGAAAALAFLFFAGLWYLSGGRALGFGDAKLAIGLGGLVGLSGLFSLLVLSFWVGAVLSLLLMFSQWLFAHTKPSYHPGRRVRMKSEVPFAPFLIIAFVLSFFFLVDILVISEKLFVALL